MSRGYRAAIGYSLLFRVWQSLAGGVSIALIAATLDPITQGYYYTFASLIALQTFFELGLYLVISVTASHEWARLELTPDGGIGGDAMAHARLISLGRFMFRWYGVAALLFAGLALAFGSYFLGRPEQVQVKWAQPWLLHVLFSAVSMWLMPFLSLLVGCDQVSITARFRLLQSVLAQSALVVALISGLGLWSLCALSGISALLLLCYLSWGRRHFFKSFYGPQVGTGLSWRRDLLPMQWRLALQGLFSYLSFPLYTVLSFAYAGAAEAGRVGMTLQIVSATQTIALVLISTRAPALAMAVASAQRPHLERVWRRATLQTVSLMIMMVIALLGALQIARAANWAAAGRVCDSPIVAMLLLGSLSAVGVQCIAVYLRAHKQELLTPVGVFSGAIYGLTAWLVVTRLGAWGLAASYLAITACVALPWSWQILRRSRRTWGAA